jgi:hypothetical protein
MIQGKCSIIIINLLLLFPLGTLFFCRCDLSHARCHFLHVGFRGNALGFRVFRVKGLGFRAQGLEFGFGVQGQE